MTQALSDIYLAVGWQPGTWLVLLALASLADALTTVYALRQSGAREANPALRWAMGKLGIIPALVLFKMALLALLFIFRQECAIYLVLLVALYTAVAVWNLLVIHRARTC